MTVLANHVFNEQIITKLFVPTESYYRKYHHGYCPGKNKHGRPKPGQGGEGEGPTLPYPLMDARAHDILNQILVAWIVCLKFVNLLSFEVNNTKYRKCSFWLNTNIRIANFSNVNAKKHKNAKKSEQTKHN